MVHRSERIHSQEHLGSLLPKQQNLIRERLGVFNKHPLFEVDFYQELPLEKMERFGWPDPRTNIPPGSITFYPDGSIVHQPFANL